jgi:NADPH:quinone reductase-like Zn-dependent oxidoreductase
MKAIVYEQYGPSNVLELRDIAKSVLRDNDVQIKVCAASINPLDWHYMKAIRSSSA